MSKFALALTFVTATAFAMPAVSSAKSPKKDQAASADKTEQTAKAETAAAPLDKEAQQKLKEHLRMRNHIIKNVKYPATKENIVSAFKGIRDVKPDDKKWFEETLPTRTYDSPDEVMKALGWEVGPADTK